LPHRAIFEEIKEQGHVNEPLLSVTIGRGIIQQEDLLANSSKKDSSNLDKSKYKLVEPGDIAYNKMRAWQGAVGVSKYRGIVSPAYIVQRLRGNLKPDYFHYLFRTPGFAKEAERWSYGITSDQWSLRPQHFKMIYSCVPPLDEQELIVGFLRELDLKVRRFIRNRRRLINVLNEQKQAIISHAVIRGLDPNAPPKPSGIDWLGDIPKHWVVKPLKRWVSINERVLPEITDPQYTFDYLDIGCVGTGRLVRKPSHIKFRDAPSRARRILGRGDTIISTVRTYLRAVYFVSEDVSDVVASTGFAVLTPREGIVPEYIGITLQSGPFINRVTANSIGIAYPAISETRLGTFHVAMPPHTDEQQAIVDQVRSRTVPIIERVERAQREIDLIREYRNRLIADVVTGKVDVRHLVPPPGIENLEAMLKALEPLDEESGESDEEFMGGEVSYADD
jgi:type I restriction enzyme S subunit